MIDITRLKENDKSYRVIVDDIAEKYRCEWDDAVYESYSRYVMQQKEFSERIHSIRCKAEMIANEVEEYSIPESIRIARQLCEEANAI